MRWAGWALVALGAAVVSAGSSVAEESMQTWLDALRNGSPEVRAEACQRACGFGAAAVTPLAELLTTGSPDVAHCARSALRRITSYAGRPGAQTEAAAVADALAKLLGGDRPVETRREVLALLSLVATDPQIPGIAALLRDAGLCEDARLTLERIPGKSATQALAEALAWGDPPLRVRIIHSLAARNAAETVKTLNEQSRSKDPGVRWAALDALSRFGILPVEVFPWENTFTPKEGKLYTDALLRAAEVQAARGNRNGAAGVYESVMVNHRWKHHACRALVGLADVRSERLVGQCLGCLGDPRLRGVAMQLLAETDIENVEDRLTRAYAQTSPSIRATLLRILARRSAPNVNDLLAEALSDESPEVRVTAAELMGKPPAIEDLRAVAQRAPIWSRTAAIEQLERLGEDTTGLSGAKRGSSSDGSASQH